MCRFFCIEELGCNQAGDLLPALSSPQHRQCTSMKVHQRQPSTQLPPSAASWMQRWNNKSLQCCVSSAGPSTVNSRGRILYQIWYAIYSSATPNPIQNPPFVRQALFPPINCTRPAESLTQLSLLLTSCPHGALVMPQRRLCSADLISCALQSWHATRLRQCC